MNLTCKSIVPFFMLLSDGCMHSGAAMAALHSPRYRHLPGWGCVAAGCAGAAVLGPERGGHASSAGLRLATVIHLHPLRPPASSQLRARVRQLHQQQGTRESLHRSSTLSPSLTDCNTELIPQGFSTFCIGPPNGTMDVLRLRTTHLGQ